MTLRRIAVTASRDTLPIGGAVDAADRCQGEVVRMQVAYGVKWGKQAVAVLLASVLAMAVLASGPAAIAHEGAGSANVVVRALPGAVDAVKAAVERSGGVVTRDLGLIEGFAATLPAGTGAALRHAPGVAAVSEDYQLRPHQATVGDLSATELGSAFNTARMIGATDLWAHGLTGEGVDVAVIDTGVLPVDGLLRPGKVVHGPDLSFDSQSDEHRHLDAYGHGTAMAGIIAGRDLDVADVVANRGAGFQGIAPDARIVSVKVGSATGAVDVSQVIAAFDWVVQHRRSGDLDIRVINLAYGTDSVLPAATDPLAYAADVAWRRGIVVVASTGNDGRGTTLAMPAQNPNIIAVGASDHRGTLGTADDRPASFSTYANGQRRPDLLAPGVSIVGLRAPGSFLDLEHPQAVRAERFFRGSGTSQAAAVTSGAVALLLQQRPSLTPDQVKQLLRSTATSLQGTSNNAQGAGLINLRAARTAATPTWTQWVAPLSGTGLLDDARGTGHLSADGVDLRGEQDIFGQPWNGSKWSADAWAGSTWHDGWWNGSKWSGSDWTTGEWAGSKWSGAEWLGSKWSGSKWSGSKWSSASWSGSDWVDPAWAGSKWSGSKWSFSDEWAGSKWSGSKWSGSKWSGSKWSTVWSGAAWE
jgi:subtilisin family serine protease